MKIQATINLVLAMASMTLAQSGTTPTSDSPSSVPSSVPSVAPSVMPSNVPSVAPSAIPSTVPSVAPSWSPSFESDPAPVSGEVPTGDAPSKGPSLAPSIFPSVSPSAIPSNVPSVAPSGSPSAESVSAPASGTSPASDAPSKGPPLAPSIFPSVTPSVVPSVSPSESPSTESSGVIPAPVPGGSPTSDSPSKGPSLAPSIFPSSQPSVVPSVSPSGSPSVDSSGLIPAPVSNISSDSDVPSSFPSISPSILPSTAPSVVPSAVPSVSPSQSPSFEPSHVSDSDPLTVSQRLVDIGFVVDVSGSFWDDIARFKSQANDIVARITDVYPNAHFGLATFQDFPLLSWGNRDDVPHAHIRDIGTPNGDFIDAVNSLTTSGGGDYRESQLVSLHQSITGSGLVVPPTSSHRGYTIPPGLNFHFRRGSSRLIILWTDALFHSPSSTAGYPGPSVADVISAALSPATRRNLRVNKNADHRSLFIGPEAIRIVGIQSGSSVSVSNSMAQIARGTGAVAGRNGVDCDGDGFIDVSEGEPLVCPVARGLTSAILNLVEGIVPEIPEIPTAPTTPRPSQSPIATIPSSLPSSAPSESPSVGPSSVPTEVPKPSAVPSSAPSESPSVGPSSVPSTSPSASPSSQPTSAPTIAPTLTRGCGKFRGCYLENLATRELIRLDPSETTSYSISGGEQYSVRCNVEGRLYNMAFVYEGKIKKERRRPYYMNGDTWNGKWPVANNVPYLSEGCGHKEFIARGRIWAGSCFTRTFHLEATCDE